jgi:hypothetical protein
VTESSSTPANDPSRDEATRAGLSDNPADYLTGPTGVSGRQGGTSRDGAVNYAEDDEPLTEEGQQVAEQTAQQQTGGSTPDTKAQPQ